MALEHEVDVDDVDLSTMDRGDELTPAVKAEASPVEPAEPVDEVVEPPAKEEPPRDEKGKFAGIPKARFDEAVGKERDAREAAEAKAADLERQLYAREQQREQDTDRGTQNEALEAKISELEKQHGATLIDGDLEKASEIMREIRMTERQVARLEIQEESNRIVSSTLEQERLNVTVAKLEADHPSLNPRSETYDADLVQMILLVHKDAVATGQPASKALAMATEKVMKRFSVAPPEAKEGLAQVAATTERQSAAVAKSLAAQVAQPSSMKEVGMDSDKLGEKALPEASKLSVEEYDALPEATRARMRGDML